MSMSIAVAVALMLPQAAPSPATGPELRVMIADLDFTRPADQDQFVRRVRDASRAFCDRHLEIVTPDRLGDPAICRREITRLAFRALPDRQRQEIALTGRYRAIR